MAILNFDPTLIANHLGLRAFGYQNGLDPRPAHELSRDQL